MFFIFKLIANNSIFMKYFIIFFRKSIFKYKLIKFFTFLCYFSKPKINKILTVLKSPHVNKTAQEQFKILTISLAIKIKTFELNKFLFFLKKIIIKTFPNLKKIIIFLFKKKLIKNIFNTFNPFQYKTQFFKKNKKKSIFLYLKLFNIFGSFLFFQNFLCF